MTRLLDSPPAAGRYAARAVAAIYVSAALGVARGDDARPVTAVTADGTQVTGRLVSVSDGVVTLAAEGSAARAVELAFDDLVSLDFSPPARTPPAPPSYLEFANGDRLAVEIDVGEQDRLGARVGSASFSVPLEALRGFAFVPLGAEEGASAVFFRGSGDRDLIRLTNGDGLSGQFAGLTPTELLLESETSETRVPRDRVAAVAFSPELVSPAAIDGPRQIVRSARGWLTVRSLALAESTWRAETAFGGSVTWPAEAVDGVLFGGGRVEFLSEREPTSVELNPYLSLTRPMRLDRDVTGEPLAAGGREFPKGLGMHSRTRATYDLKGGYASFRAVLALARSAGETGSAEFAVEVDGREVYRSGPVTSADAKPVTLDLTGAETLVLTVDFGRNGDVLDRANWCDAVLVRK